MSYRLIDWKTADCLESYLRTDFLAKRTQQMADWARYWGIAHSVAADNVVPIKKGAA